MASTGRKSVEKEEYYAMKYLRYGLKALLEAYKPMFSIYVVSYVHLDSFP